MLCIPYEVENGDQLKFQLATVWRASTACALKVIAKIKQCSFTKSKCPMPVHIIVYRINPSAIPVIMYGM